MMPYFVKKDKSQRIFSEFGVKRQSSIDQNAALPLKYYCLCVNNLAIKPKFEADTLERPSEIHEHRIKQFRSPRIKRLIRRQEIAE